MSVSETLPLSVERLLAAERIVGYRPCFASAFGGVSCAVLLSQFWYWTNTPTVRARGGWFWKCQREITEETGLTRTEAMSARRKLRALGLLQEMRRDVPARLYFRLDVDVMTQRLTESLTQRPSEIAPRQSARTRMSSLQESCKLDVANPANKCSQNLQSTTETTAEKTQEKTQRPEDLPAAWEIPEKQQQVNRQGAARLKAALDAARSGKGPAPA